MLSLLLKALIDQYVHVMYYADISIWQNLLLTPPKSKFALSKHGSNGDMKFRRGIQSEYIRTHRATNGQTSQKKTKTKPLQATNSPRKLLKGGLKICWCSIR